MAAAEKELLIMPDLLQLLQRQAPQAGDIQGKIPLANVDIRWRGMRQDFDTPGAYWRDYGPLRHSGSHNPRGPTDPAVVQGFKPYPLSSVYKGETPAYGTPQNLEAPRPFTDVPQHRGLDLSPSRLDYHTGGPDVQSTLLTTASTGSSLPRHAVPPRAWNPHMERIGALGMATAYQTPPTMSQYPGTRVADNLTPEEFKVLGLTASPGDKGTLVVSFTGAGLLAEVPWIRDLWADRFLQDGLQVENIDRAGLNDFIVHWKAHITTGMSAGPLLVGVVILAILLVLGWLAPRLTMFVERSTAGVGTGIQGIGVGIGIAALGLAILARSSKRGLI